MKRVLIVFGSKASEHEVSCVSAYSILNNIDKNKYDVKMLGIDKEGTWFEYTGDIVNLKKNTWIVDVENKIKIENIIEYLKCFDTVFPVLHGKYGEGGFIQGLFEIAEVNYVGCDVLGSSVAMNKTITKRIVETLNIPIVNYVNITENEFNGYLINDKKKEELIDMLIGKIGFPMFVKPNQEGSSYGVTKVNKKDDIFEAINYALKFDSSVLIEKYISNKKEVECAIIERDNNVVASTPGEICSACEVYDYDSKYNNSASYTKIPAEISLENLNKIKEYSKNIFKALGLTSIARVDFFVSDDKIYFNEVNTMPGFTDISMYPKMLMHDKMEYKEIIDILIENSLKNKN